MPVTHLLDTAVVSSIICEAEVLFGIRNEKRKNSETKIEERYAALLKGKCDLLPVDYAVAEAYAELRDDLQCRGKTVAHADLLIAATAKANNLIVATLNVKHFEVIRGITVEDWSIPIP